MASDLPGQQTPASDTSLAMTWRRDGLIAVGLPLAAGVAVRGYGGSATGDDTFIYMRYVAHALAGDGYVFNVGEASYGFTSALWVLVMTPIAALGGNRVEVWQWASSLMFAASSVVVFGRLRWGGVGATRATALAVVSLLEPHTFRWASSGMENGLTALVLALVVSLIHQPEAVPERFRLWVGAFLGSLPFTRPELAILAVAALTVLRCRAGWLGALLVTGCGAAVACLVWGAPVPQTAAAKAIALRQDVPTYAIRQVLLIMLSGGGAALVLVGLLRRAMPRWVPGLALAGIAVVGYLAIANQLVSTRYSTTLTYPFLLTAVLGVGGESRWRMRALLLMQAMSAGAVLFWCSSIRNVTEHEDVLRFSQRVRAVTPPTARIAISEVGAFGFYTDRYIVDPVGLVDGDALQWNRAHGRATSGGELEAFLRHRRADYYVDAFAQDASRASPEPFLEYVLEGSVQRNNLSAGHTSVPATWRLYRVVSGR